MQTDYKPFGVANQLTPPEPDHPTIIQRIFNLVPFYRQSSEGVDFSWFKWYYVLIGIFVFCYVIMLSESISESRKTRANKSKAAAADKKEGMCGIHSRPAGILKHRTREERVTDHQKRVSFYKNNLAKNELFTFDLSEMNSRLFRYIYSTVRVFYEWWLVPWGYSVIRTFY